MQVSRSTHRRTFINNLTEDIRQRASDESLSFHAGTVHVLLQWLGYEPEDIYFVDDGERGIDAWLATEAGIDIFQINTHELSATGDLDLSTFDGQGVHDLEHAKNFLLHERDINVLNKNLKQLIYQWDSAIRSHKLEGSTIAMPVTLHLVILGEQLTTQAYEEFRSFQLTNETILSVDEVPVQFHAVLYTVNEIIDGKWRESNRSWVDLQGRKREFITLRPWKEGSINDNANAIFYCSAIDLVTAYDALGYQLFEPNVRENIRASRVNQAIRDSVLHQRTRHEFRFLNNGVTITCDNFSKPNQQRPLFKIMHPGIVNGLQTVVALHTAYSQLSDLGKEDFEKNCSVLVRLLMNNAVEDITRVVIATNNQNPMKPRNLVSNNMEQLIFARLFAEQLGWFYEAKEGAWDAFEKDPKRWRPTLKKQPKDFRANNRRKVRRVDNEDLAQTWLAFIGFAYEAVNDKKWLFDDRFYPLIFTHRTLYHGFDYDFVLSRARDEADKQSPDASLMLVSSLSRVLAAEMPLSATQNRQEACERLAIDPNRLTKAELDSRLNDDNTFLLNQALGGMSLLFTEFVGFIFFRAFGEHIHRYGQRIIANGGYSPLRKEFALDTVKEHISTGSFDQHDILAVLWLAFVETIDDMLYGEWGRSYRAAPIKVRFIFSRETRERLYRQIQSTNEFMKKRSMKQTWAIGVAEGQGLFDFVRSCILE